jgi:thiol-disulfide isomerase/thioredoxin
MRTVMLVAVVALSLPSPSGAIAAPKKLDLRKEELYTSTLDGKAVKLGKFAGKKGTLVNLWATWCGPCVQEMPELSKLHDKYKSKGFNVIGIDVDEAPATVREFLVKRGVSYPILASTKGKTVAMLGQLEALPTTMVLDEEGDVSNVLVGAIDVPEVEKIVEDALAGKKKK